MYSVYQLPSSINGEETYLVNLDDDRPIRITQVDFMSRPQRLDDLCYGLDHFHTIQFMRIPRIDNYCKLPISDWSMMFNGARRERVCVRPTFKGLLSGVSNPSFIIGSEIDWRFLMVAVFVAEIGITRLTNL